MSTLTQFLPQQGSVIKSVQRGVISIGSASQTASATISSVTTGKSSVNFLGSIGTATTDPASSNMVRIELVSSTSVEATRNNTIGTATVSYEVVEYN